MYLIWRWIIAAGALWVTVYAGQRIGLDIRLAGALPAVIAVVVLAVANGLIGTIVRLLTLPISCLTLGLFGFIINALIFWLIGGTGIVGGFEVHGFKAALFGSVVMGLICGFTNKFIHRK